MEGWKKSAMKLAVLLAFMVISSEMWMKSEARGPVVRLHCTNDSQCQYNCPNCGCKCINTWCRCPIQPFTHNIPLQEQPPNHV
ncbi:unnamed protein product [Sphenostylis stenocarpa]|uniref:Uncharacterized protein n=1 Tax=Sphenostylis stenocarpa TaxID=92480 RepID=A0AA86TB59_9FABA|nr:unnamed protein product [Sphenostylis stenocarpa]